MRNSKIWTIIKHEYLKKVTSKGFIIGTILAPIGLLLIILVPSVVIYFTQTSDTDRGLVLINDESGLVASRIVEIDANRYQQTTETEQELKDKILAKEIPAAVILTKNCVVDGKAKILVGEATGQTFINKTRSDVDREISKVRLVEAGIEQTTIDLVNASVNFETIKVTAQGAVKDDSEIMSILSYVIAFVMYGLMFLYGSQVMMGVMEEKTNRIVEILASSVTPFQIMFGKVVGIGAVGLTQVVLWLVLSGGAMFVLGFFIGTPSISPEMMTEAMNTNPTAAASSGFMGSMLESFEMPNISLWYVVGFIFYFLSGYFIFSTLFAAAGATVDQMQDSSSMSTPLSMLIIIPIMLIPSIALNPEGTLAIVASLFPFFTPILMMSRVVTISVPLWEIILSVVLQIVTFFLCLKLAAKIYRMGMLRYGKKANWAEIISWVKK